MTDGYPFGTGTQARDRDLRAVREVVVRYGPAAIEVLDDPTKVAATFPQAAPYVGPMRKPQWYARRPSMATWDHRGRLIFVCGAQVFAVESPEAEPVELLDLSKTVWSHVASLDWAKEW